MGRKNRRKKSSYSRKLRVNPKRLISRKPEQVHNNEDSSVRQTQHSDLMPQRGEVWFAELGEHPGTSVQEGCRPAFIMSNNMANTHSETVTVVPMTSKMKKPNLPTHVALASSDIEKRPVCCSPLEPSIILPTQFFRADYNDWKKCPEKLCWQNLHRKNTGNREGSGNPSWTELTEGHLRAIQK